MARKLPDVVLLEEEEQKLEVELKNIVDQKSKDDATEGLRRCVTEMKLKMRNGREQCKQFLDTACHVEENDDETLYRTLFGLIIKTAWIPS